MSGKIQILYSDQTVPPYLLDWRKTVFQSSFWYLPHPRNFNFFVHRTLIHKQVCFFFPLRLKLSVNSSFVKCNEICSMMISTVIFLENNVSHGCT